MKGYYQNDTKCEVCAMGTYKDVIGNAPECTACPDKMTTDSTGSDNANLCSKL